MALPRAPKPRTKAKAKSKLVTEEREESSDSDLEPGSDELNISSPDVLDTAADDGHIGGFSNDEDNSDEEDESLSDGDSGEDVQRKLAHVSFGALAKAQDSLSGEGRSRKRKRGQEDNEEAEDKLKALRERLRELREAKVISSLTSGKKKVEAQKSDVTPRKKSKDSKGSSFTRGESPEEDKDQKQSDTEASSDLDSDSGPSDGDGDNSKKLTRSSKHAPTVQSSKRAVTRKRTIIPVAQPTLGDPRFERFTGRLNTSSVAQRYSFLESYRASELAELKNTLKTQSKRLNDEAKENLKRKILSYETKQKVQQEKEREKKIIKEHRKKEIRARKQGKNPYYLKKSEVKKQALTQKFEGMKAREKDRAIQRRRKKLAAREKKSMPADRRM